MLFTRENLTNEYEWSQSETVSPFTGDLTRRNFNRFSGDQMLFIINCYATLTGNFNLAACHEIENQLMNKLPFKPQSELSVMDWLIENFSNDSPGSVQS